ncbi:MAG: hypothetical protein ACREK4_00110 [Candidatus Rokuibacteriota bacterium]
MTVLTSSSVFTIGAGGVLTESIAITVLPAAAPGTGKGRLIHPTLGTFDYPHAPDSWTNLPSDVVIQPVWANARTLDGAANTLWPGSIQDVEVAERWESPISMKVEFLNQLILFWTNPPAPPSFVEWRPSYQNTLGYKVMMLKVTCGGNEVTLDYVSRQGWVRGTTELRMRLIGYA